MTISTTTAKSRYAGDGATTSFPTGFKFLDNDHVKVILRDAAGAETVWTEGSEYALTGAGAPGGGTVAVSTSPTDHTPNLGEVLVVKLAISPSQETSLPLGGAFSSTAVEAMADLAALRDQQVAEALSRAVKFTETTALADVAFPEPEAWKVLAWDSGGTTLENVDKPADGADGAPGADGADGADGAKILFGGGTPGAGVGVVGDYYKDTATSDVYEKTGASAWTLRGNDKGPQGDPGADGADGTPGADGAAGADGVGVPAGGTTGQVLAKIDATDYNTQWITPAGGGGGGAVDSVFGRTGVVTAQAADYDADQISETASNKVMTAAERTKLAGVATGANNYTHPNHSGDVTSTGDGTTVIANDAVDNAKLANVAADTIKGRVTASTGDPEDLTPAQARSVIGVEPSVALTASAYAALSPPDSGTIYFVYPDP